MKIPRDLSGADLIRTLCRSWGYRIIHQVGSHVILQTEIPTHQRIAIPNHNPLRIGTLNAIIRTVSAHKGVERQKLLDTL